MEEKKIVENVTWLIHAKTKPALHYFRELLRKTFELEERNQIKEILNKLTELHTIHNQIKCYKSYKVEGKYEHYHPLYAFDYSYLVINDPGRLSIFKLNIRNNYIALKKSDYLIEHNF